MGKGGILHYIQIVKKTGKHKCLFHILTLFEKEITFVLSMRQGAFWFRNGTIQSIDNFVPNLDFWIKSIYLGYHYENDTETTVTIEHNWWDKHPMKSEFATWKPFIFDLYFGQCYTLQLNQTKKFTSVVLNLNGNRNLQMYAHSPGRIRSIPNPAWYLPNKGTYM